MSLMMIFFLSTMTAGCIVKFAVKETLDDFALVVAFHDKNTLNKNRDTRFMARYLYHHLWVRGKSVIHGVGGSTVLISAILCLLWYHITSTRGPQKLWQFFFVAQNMQTFGMLTPYMIGRQLQLGFRRFTLQKHIFVVAAHGAMTASMYCNNMGGSFQQFDVATVAAFSFFALAFLIQLYELYWQYVWSTKDVMITFIPAIPVIYGPLLYGLMFGQAALQQLYQTTKVADALYLINVATVFCVSVDQFLLTLFNRKVMSMEQRLRIIGIMWMGFGIFYCNLSLTFLVSVKAAIAYTMFFALKYPASWLIPEWCFENMEENRKGLYNAEHAGLKVSPFANSNHIPPAVLMKAQ